MTPQAFARNGVRAFLSAMGLEIRGLHQAAYLLALFALLSQFLALLRDRLLASTFGASHALDVYYASFRVPDLLFATVASLLSLYALLPILSRLETDGRAAAFLEKALVFFCAGMGAIAAVLFVYAPSIAALVAPGLPPQELSQLMRILLLQPMLLGASNMLASLTQLRHRFLLYAVSPLLYNLGIIIGIAELYPRMGLPGLAWGVVLGAALHLGLQLPFFFRESRSGGRMSYAEAWRGVRQVLRLSVPRTLALTSGQISLLLLTAMASFFAPGSIAVFTFAFNLQAVPLTIIGVSYSVAAFPTLSRLHAAGKRGEFVRHIEAALRHVLFWTIPAMVFVIVLRAQLVRTILGAGAFDWEDTRLVAAALALFVISLSAQSVTLLIARAYYAAGETLRPLWLAALSVVTSVLSAALLTVLFHRSAEWRYFLESLLRVADIPGTTVLMLALGYCLGALLQAGLGLLFLGRDFRLELSGLRRLLFESFAAATIGGAAAYAVLTLLGGWFTINTSLGIALEGAAAGVAGLMVAAAMLALLGNRELVETYGSLRKRLVKEPPVVEATEVS